MITSLVIILALLCNCLLGNITNGSYYDNIDGINVVTICPKGHYCLNGVKFSCPGGFYGNSEGLSSNECTGPCPEGWYCGISSIDPTPCSTATTVFCPARSTRPVSVAQGYYASNSHIDSGGGYGNQIKCPQGSYCVNGIKYLCPGGHFGLEFGEYNSSCSGLCEAGWYCPPGSIRKRQLACGNSSCFCPEGAAYPKVVTEGHYTSGNIDNTSMIEFTGDHYLNLHRIFESSCEPGFFCSSDGIRRKCPAGRFGSNFRLSNSQCDGPCNPGYYCPSGSTSPNQIECGGYNFYCPGGSSENYRVDIGYYSIGGSTFTTMTSQQKCEPGYYCQLGKRFKCHGGYYGDLFGMIFPNCSGGCEEGYFCPEGSVTSKQFLCGDPDKYCPSFSAKPTNVDRGYYSIGGNFSTRTSQMISPMGSFAISGIKYSCLAGYFGSSEGLYEPECSGRCYIPGYFCDSGSISPIGKVCGNDSVYCPPGAVSPIPVSKGYYTADYLYESCPPGTFRNYSLLEYSNGSSLLITQEFIYDCSLCPYGTYKPTSGDSLSDCLPCDKKYSISSNDRIVCICEKKLIDPNNYFVHFNISSGLCVDIPKMDLSSLILLYSWDLNTSVTRYAQYICDLGHYCQSGVRYRCPSGYYGNSQQQTSPLCSGPCAEGFFCPQASVSPYSVPCGEANLICPKGSKVPTIVPPAYYTNENSSYNQRYISYLCPDGYFCPGDGYKYICPAGKYSNSFSNISESKVSCFDCERGYYCVSGSTTPTQNACGSSKYYCPTGSGSPRSVHTGFYCWYSGPDAAVMEIRDINKQHCSIELPCEPGYFCLDGSKNMCPPGRYGWSYGLSANTCSGLCPRGYYCPSYLTPQLNAPPHTIWPRKPQINATEFQCGGIEYFCPEGSYYPTYYSGGYYTVGGGKTTRYNQEICPAGSYCLNGMIYPCPKGKYGNATGLTNSACSGWCPESFYCPEGTSIPIQCPMGYFSVGAAYQCSLCPGNIVSKLTCQNSLTCCFTAD